MNEARSKIGEREVLQSRIKENFGRAQRITDQILVLESEQRLVLQERNQLENQLSDVNDWLHDKEFEMLSELNKDEQNSPDGNPVQGDQPVAVDATDQHQEPSESNVQELPQNSSEKAVNSPAAKRPMALNQLIDVGYVPKPGDLVHFDVEQGVNTERTRVFVDPPLTVDGRVRLKNPGDNFIFEVNPDQYYAYVPVRDILDLTTVDLDTLNGSQPTQ